MAKSTARKRKNAPAPDLKKFTADQIVMRKVDDLVPFPNNPKIHTPEQIAAIEANIKAFGFDQPILVDENDTILKGHGRQLAARKLGIEVPTIVHKGLSPADKWAIVISDNVLPAMTGLDSSLLRIGLTTLAKLDYDLNLTGYDNVRLATFGVGKDAPQAEPQDIISPVLSNPVTKAGDLWILGDHKLICGDCRNAKNVASLVGSAKINLAFTSPPYAEQRDYDTSSGFKPVAPDEYVEWFAQVSALVAKHLAADGSWFVNIKPNSDGLDTSLYVLDLVLAHARKWGWHFATEFCWERGGVPGKVVRRFKNQFEPVYQFTRGEWKIRPAAVSFESENVPGGLGKFNARPPGERSGSPHDEHRQGKTDWNSPKKRAKGTTSGLVHGQGTNWQPGEYVGNGMAYPGNRLPTFASSHDAMGHAAAFPVGLPEFFCKAYTDIGDVVYDPFMGSGSTLIAVHKTNRVGLGCEISPAYCDIIVKRWQTFAGKKAILQGTKRTFDQVEKERSRKAA